MTQNNHKTVKGIVTKGVDKTEYMQLYRTQSTEECIRKLNEMGKLDTDFYKKVINTMKTDPKLRNLIKGFCIICMIVPMTMFSTVIAISSIIHLYL